jgi:signal transduction histidine kinase
MHDVVAHSMSVMVAQAGGARRILERDPVRAREAAELIAGTGREALVELQRLLGVLHLEPAAAPTLDGLDGLVERARAAGLPVALTVDGERRRLPDGVEHAAYRVARRPSPTPSSTRVRPRPRFVSPTACRMSSCTSATVERAAWRPRAWAAAATGLVGMRERVRIFGGELHTGRRAGGGFEVRARVPLDGRAEHA